MIEIATRKTPLFYRPPFLLNIGPDPTINPEILPEEVLRVRKDAIFATGRSDYPNQVNNVLCFPYLFRGALDVRAKKINEAMQLAAVYAISNLAKESIPEEVLLAYGIERGLSFGPAYLLPKPIDPRLKERISSAVSEAAIASGVASCLPK